MPTTRRNLLALGALSALGWATRPRSALGAVACAPGRQEPAAGVLVTIFLRGGADGLSLVAPWGDDDYARSRPSLALASPRDRRSGPGERLLDLDGFFGLHPALSPLWPLWEQGQMAPVHACGSGDRTRSHFEAMATVERGGAGAANPAGGWLARHLQSAPWDNGSPLRAVALGTLLPASLAGWAGATALQTVDDFHLNVPFAGRDAAVTRSLAALYGGPGGAPRNGGDPALLARAGREALSVLRTLRSLPPDGEPSGHAGYPADPLGQGLRQVARLMRSEVGLETACLDQNGYDTHVAQGRGQGVLAGCLGALARGLAAFAADLGPARWNRTLVVVLSEFGRRVAENDGLGTDHGRGGVLLLLGGRGLAAGRVHGRWPGLAAGRLEGPGDLPVTTDFRNVLAEILVRRAGNPHLDAVFPGLAYQAPGVVHA